VINKICLQTKKKGLHSILKEERTVLLSKWYSKDKKQLIAADFQKRTGIKRRK
jgi:hypothetical protein